MEKQIVAKYFKKLFQPHKYYFAFVQVQNVMIGSVIGTAAFLGIAFASISAFMKNGSDREKIDDVDSQEKSNKVHR